MTGPELTLFYKNQQFPVFDPISQKFISYMPRLTVHQEGNWHKGLQANIIRKSESGKYGFDILLQRRSNLVDLSQNKLDQSLATQLTKEDQLDSIRALERGLKEELGLLAKDYVVSKVPTPKIRIIKTYIDQPKMLNRELIALYAVLLNENVGPILKSEKVSELIWIPWDIFIEAPNNFFNSFTKTAQFYFKNSLILDSFLNTAKVLIENKKNKPEDLFQSEWILHANLDGFAKTISTTDKNISNYLKWFEINSPNSLEIFFANEKLSEPEAFS